MEQMSQNREYSLLLCGSLSLLSHQRQLAPLEVCANALMWIGQHVKRAMKKLPLRGKVYALEKCGECG